MIATFRQSLRTLACWRRMLLATLTVTCTMIAASLARGDVLLDDKFADGSRAESKRPAEAAVWAGRKLDVAVKPGAPITLVPTVERIHLFDQQSGRRLEAGA